MPRSLPPWRHLTALAAALPVAALALSIPASGAQAAGIGFAAPVQLDGGCGGEPSIDLDGQGHVYVSAPKGILAGTASCDGLASGTRGAATWASNDGGVSFGSKVSAGTANGGGDTDTQIIPSTGDVYLADLEAIGSDICVSHDHGQTYVSYLTTAEPCSTESSAPPAGATSQSGFEADREWLTTYGPTPAYKHTDVYLTYHDFAVGQPLQWMSQDGGPFVPEAAPAFTDPTFESAVVNGTVMAKPVIDKDGTIYALVTTQGPAQGSLNHLWLITSKDHGNTWTDTSIFAGASNAQLGLVFNDLAIDGAGDLYALALGNALGLAPPVHAYLFSSTDHGATWSKPTDINASGTALALAGMHGGPRAGQLVIGWYQATSANDPNDLKALWTYQALESTNATSATPAFTTAQLGVKENAQGLVHQGQICTQGILCTTGQLQGVVNGDGEGNRNLADFSSVTVDPTGCAIFTYADDGAILTDQSNFAFSLVNNDVARQTSGCFATAPPASVPEAPIGAALVLIGLGVGGAVVALRRRRPATS